MARYFRWHCKWTKDAPNSNSLNSGFKTSFNATNPKHRKKYQKSNLDFAWFLPGFIKIHVQVRTKFVFYLVFFLDFLLSIKNRWFFLFWILKKPASSWIFRKPRRCTLFSLISRFGKSLWVFRYPVSQIPNLDNFLTRIGFLLNPNLDKSKNKNGT